MKKLFLIFNLFVIALSSQTITPSVINSGGKTSNATLNTQPIIYTDNIGEVIIETGKNTSNILTQGFLQPQMIVVDSTIVSVVPTDVSCIDKADGYIKVIIDNLPAGATVKYYWNPVALCPSSDCDRIDDLSAGTFSVMVKWTYTSGQNTKTDSAFHSVSIAENNIPCKIKPYKGITINGNNPTFTIDNIEDFPDAKVTIFNRWGKLLFNTSGYNNRDNNWPTKGEEVIAGTYFYVIEFSGDVKPIKGWVEVFN